MKRIICIVLSIVLIFFLSACERNYTHGEYEIKIHSTCVENNKVGNDWVKIYRCNGNQISSKDKITALLGEEVTIRAQFTEQDKYSDTGSSSVKIVLEDGAKETFDVRVVEDNGAYDGNVAIWRVNVEVKLLKKKCIRN